MGLISAGILMYREGISGLEVLLAHPGGPFFIKKDERAWTIPKGLVEEGEEGLKAAIREFEEEIGFAPAEPFISLGEITQKGGKKVVAWAAAEREVLPVDLKSNFFSLEWPPKSGKYQKFPEIDKAAYFTSEEAMVKIMPAQIPFITRLQEHLKLK